MEASVWSNKSLHIYSIFTCSVHCKSHWSGLRPLISIIPLMLDPQLGLFVDFQLLPCVVENLQLWISVSGHMLQKIGLDQRQGECWGRKSHNSGSGPGQLKGWSARWKMSTILPSSQFLGWVTYTCSNSVGSIVAALARWRPTLLTVLAGGGREWISHSYDQITSSPTCFQNRWAIGIALPWS